MRAQALHCWRVTVNGTSLKWLATQRHVVCELQQLHDTIVREQLASPSVIVVGDVFKGLLAMQSGSDLQASVG